MSSMFALKIARSELSKFLPTPQLIKQFEAIQTDVTDNLPAAAEQAQETADQALTNIALVKSQPFVVVTPSADLQNSRVLSAGTGIGILDALGAITVRVLDFLESLYSLGTSGFVVRDAGGAAITRSITAASPKVSITNGDGAEDNPDIDVNESELNLANMAGVLGVAHGGTGVDIEAAFGAHNNGVSQSIPNGGVFTKLTFSTADYDQGLYFSASSWTPPAGRPVLISGACQIASTASGLFALAVYKNGVQFKQGTRNELTVTGTAMAIVSCMDLPTGSDVYDIRMYQTSVTAQPTNGGSEVTYFQGAML